MKVVLDGVEQSLDFKDKDVSNLSILLEQIVLEIPAQKVISGLMLDGQNVPAGNNVELSKMPIMKNSILEVKTVFLKELVQNTIHCAKEHLPHLLSALEETSDNFRTGNKQNVNLYLTALDGIETFLTVLEEANNSMMVLVGKQNFETSDLIGPIVDLLGRMVDIQEGDDFVMLADIIEFELIPSIKTIAGELERMESSIVDSTAA